MEKNPLKSVWGAILLLCSSVLQRLDIAAFAIDLTDNPWEGLGGQMLP